MSPQEHVEENGCAVQASRTIIDVMLPCGPAIPEEKGTERFESQRSLELRKFFAPQHTHSSSLETAFNDTLNNDGALDAYAETILWRLRGAHAMVSLVDRGEQWFLGGARRVGLDAEVSSTWFGCSSVLTPGGLCENTLKLDATKEEHPCFIVNDLSQDERFQSLPVVNGKLASYRFYAGTPITTSHGIHIGSFFFFDTEPHDGLSPTDKKFLFQSAANVMKHLEMKREAAERHRVALMSKGIATFLDRTSRENTVLEEFSGQESPSDVAQSSVSEGGANVAENADGPPDGEKEVDTRNKMILDKIRMTLDHAADILRESLELNVGGVVFLDTAIGYTDTGITDGYIDTDSVIGAHVEQKQYEEVAEERRQSSSGSARRPTLLDDHHDAEKQLSQGQIRSSTDKYRAAKVQAMSAAKIATWDSEKRVMDGKTLQTLLNSYPKGNIWYIDDEGYFSSVEQVQEQEKQGSYPMGRRPSVAMIDIAKKKAEASMLSDIFPKSKQVIFLPLWDAGSDRWYSGVFVWSLSSVPVFTVESEIAYLLAFTNSVMMSISRLDAISAGKMKSDFISSISHEFRSPLHGILASADFLRDSHLDPSQLEFISTIQNCSETLLDTINHVLDYSKINSFEMKKRGEQGTISNELYSVTNLALLCEDVVNGLIAAKEFQGSDEGIPLHSYSPPVTLPTTSKVEIIIDIEKRDWNFKLQAGALRRIIMNLFGNAQKYTNSGCVMVQLGVLPSAPNPPPKIKRSSGGTLSLQVRDTGRGMTKEFMDRKLYRPFAQEDSFAPGVGLGLSIVLSIVNQLGGTIEIRSDIGKGTLVEVLLPLEQPSEKDLQQTIPSSSSNATEAMSEIQKRAMDNTILICRGEMRTASEYHSVVWKSIEKYCSEWFGFRISRGTKSEKMEIPDLILTDCSYPIESLDGERVLVVHGDMTCRSRQESRHNLCIGHITTPITPFKLARSILTLLNMELSKSESSTSRKDAGTQTPLASPEEFLASMIEYGFFPKALTPIAMDPDSPQKTASTETSTRRFQDHDEVKREALATMNALSLNEIPDGFEPKLPQTPRKSLKKEPPMLVNSTNKFLEVPLRILAVDDNTLNLQLLTRYLQKRTADIITTATNGVEAVSAVRNTCTQPFDVIFMDISMPEMDGFEATRLIRSFERSWRHREYEQCGGLSPLIEGGEFDERSGNDRENNATSREGAYIVALTGLASRRDRDKAEEIGFDDFLTKPISFAKIGELLKKLSSEKAH